MSYGGAKIARPEGFHVEVGPMTACRLLSLALTLLSLAGVPAFAAGMDEVKHLNHLWLEPQLRQPLRSLPQRRRDRDGREDPDPAEQGRQDLRGAAAADQYQR